MPMSRISSCMREAATDGNATLLESSAVQSWTATSTQVAILGEAVAQRHAGVVSSGTSIHHSSCQAICNRHTSSISVTPACRTALLPLGKGTLSPRAAFISSQALLLPRSCTKLLPPPGTATWYYRWDQKGALLCRCKT